MNPETLQALKQSIEKWKGNASGLHMKIDTCPLCVLFYRSQADDDYCKSCPVSAHTKKALCLGTPFKDATLASTLEEFRAAAQLEVEFLESLLPKTVPKPKLTNIRINTSQSSHELRLDWDNGRHHAIRLESLTPEDVSRALESAGLLIMEAQHKGEPK